MGISVLVAGDLAFREAIAAALGCDYTVIETDSASAAADALLAARPALAFVDGQVVGYSHEGCGQ